MIIIKNILLKLTALGLVLTGLTGCLKEEYSLSGAAVPEGEPVEMTISFGAPQNEIDVSTKSTLEYGPENKIFNMYLFIFDMDKDGKKIYANYFDHNSLNASTMSDWWQVTNSQTSGTKTTGELHIHTVSKSNCTIVAITNIDAEMVNVSPEQLSTVEKYSDLYNQKATLNQLITSRSGYFPMSGKLTSVNTGTEASWGPLVLQRLDAKIKFEVYVDLSVDAEGNPVSKIAEFEPLKWEVVNLPKRSYILERGSYATGNLSTEQRAAIQDAGSTASDFFNQSATNFETEEVTEAYYSGTTQYKKCKHGFSFYMMENRAALKDASSAPANYSDREKQEKTNTQTVGDIVKTTNGDFVYPVSTATYVVITGRVRMNNVEFESSVGATLSADVQYVVHLGDFSDSKWGDYNIFRNHTYTYNVIIHDVNDIRTEVTNNYERSTQEEKMAENEAGASGRVSVALEEIFTSDAHYSSHVITFHAKNIDADKVTWMVKTPFNPSGASPVVTNGIENTAGIDYEWVEFRVNDKDESGNYFDHKRQIYKPREGEYADGKTMNISALVSYLKTQKKLYDAGKTNDFDATATEDGGPKISVTAFVNEYYYLKNPITGEYQKDLWKKFVNQPMRFMYILSETKSSADKESQIIGASFTIQQKSIQSIYNMDNADLESAWGSEHVDDEMENQIQKYDPKGSGRRNNTSHSNGRENTLKEWTLINPNGTNRILGDIYEDEAYWSHYMNLTADNETPMMLSDYQRLRYSCMSRNRDNNGNGVIDEDEVRWYMGAHNQLIGLFMGSYGIEGDARLYQRTAQERASSDKYLWRQHVIASTVNSSGNSSSDPYVIWGEEGLSAGNPNDSQKYASIDKFSTRCLRNLGYDPDTDADITYSPISTEPQNYIVAKRLVNGEEYTGSFNNNVYYEFDCSRINTASRRYYTDRELVQHDEDGEQACLYTRFMSHPNSETVNISSIPEINGKNSFKKMNEYLDSNIGHNPYCPEGYRIPNVRELAVLRDFIVAGDVSSYIYTNTPSRTHWSFGVVGKYKKDGTRYGWGASYQKVFMLESHTFNQIRCVKDIKQD